MSIERDRKLGALSRLREELRKLENRASGILESIRLNCWHGDQSSPLDLDAQKIADYVQEYEQVHATGRTLRKQINAMEDELGV